MMAKRDELIVGLDIGTTKIVALVGEVKDSGIDVIGLGTAPSNGLRKGVVTHIDNTVAAIKHAVGEAANMAGCEISNVFAGIAGGHIQGLNSHGMVAIKNGEVGPSDIARVIDAAKAVAIPMDREIIHVLPQDFIVDGQDEIKEPLGMSGVRLETRVHIVTAALPSAQNIIKCCDRCDLAVDDLVLQPLASAEAVLHDDEKELGVALIDIGGGTTDISIFLKGSIVHTSVLPLGGNNVTNDISYGLHTPFDDAEKIKRQWGCATTRMVEPEEEVEVASVGGRAPRKMPRSILCEIIQPRVEEILMLAQQEVAATGLSDLLAAGAVLTGGTVIMEGVPELAEDLLEMQVRRGSPTGIGGLVDVVKSPKFSTAVGLVQHGAKLLVEAEMAAQHDRPPLGTRMKNWFARVF